MSTTLSVLSVIVLIFDFGFNQVGVTQEAINIFYFVVLIVGVFATIIRHFIKKTKVPFKIKLFDSVSILITLFVLYHHFFGFGSNQSVNLMLQDYWIEIAVLLMFVREFSEVRVNYKNLVLNPAQVFIISFVLIILLGTMLLMLPNSTVNGINFHDALFTSTSAVCVTGLIVVDTSTYFTEFGQFIILILIQIGGLGILTFASYFSYFFKGSTSYENHIFLRDVHNSQKLGEVFSTLKRVILITIIVELIGAIIIYFQLDNNLVKGFQEQVFFSIFHSVSAFCNAGFSTLSNGLYETGFNTAYGIQFSLIIIFILGGLGFPIMVNILTYFRYLITSFIKAIFKGERNTIKPWVLNLNSRITLVTTGLLIVFGTIAFFFTEYNNTLAEHHGVGKFITALFGATTPRTAGFNTVDMGALTAPTLLITMFLMWVGASPASTGGGIKTSTIAIATMNIISLARGKSRIEVYRREIAAVSIRRAFAIISLSLIMIGFGVWLIKSFDPNQPLVNIAFECFSAYSTVGLSVGITGDLSDASQNVLIAMMFIGRISMLTILLAIFKKEKYKNYSYPTEEIVIN